MADTELPDWALHEGAEPIRAPNTDEVRSLLASAESSGPRLHAFVLVVAATGMRRGEACAIRWANVDLDHATVVIDESVVTTNGGVEVKARKSDPAFAGSPSIR